MSIRLPLFSDMHIHWRAGDLLRAVAPYTTRCCKYGLLMPNTTPNDRPQGPVKDTVSLAAYKEAVEEAIDDLCDRWFQPLYTIKLTPQTTPDDIDACAKLGAVAAKIYPESKDHSQQITTNSEGGLTEEYFDPPETVQPDNLRGLHPYWQRIIPALSRNKMKLSVHPEHPGAELDVLDRESEFLNTGFVLSVLQMDPDIKVVLEHLTTWQSVRYVNDLNQHYTGRMAGTITLHHLIDDLNAVIGGMLESHNFCKPIPKPKREKHREALIAAAISGKPWFFLGSDSAPHEVSSKHACRACAGCFTAPVLAEILTEVFEDHGSLDKLPGFGSYFGADFYGLERSTEEMVLTLAGADTHYVPQRVGDPRADLVPWKYGRRLRYRLTGVHAA